MRFVPLISIDLKKSINTSVPDMNRFIVRLDVASTQVIYPIITHPKTYTQFKSIQRSSIQSNERVKLTKKQTEIVVSTWRIQPQFCFFTAIIIA